MRVSYSNASIPESCKVHLMTIMMAMAWQSCNEIRCSCFPG